MNITARLREIAREHPDAQAIVCAGATDGVPEGRVYSYAELDRVVDAIALRAAGWNLPPGKHVALLLKQHLPLILLRLGLARAGIPTCNVPAYDEAGARIVTRDEGQLAGVRTIVAERSWWSEPSAVPAPMIEDDDALLARQATSGSTGAPKLVEITHGMYRARWRRLFTGPPPPRRPRMLCTIGPGGGPAFGYMVAVFERQGTVVVPGPHESYASTIERHAVNLLFANPHTAAGIIEQLPAGAAPPPGLEQVYLTGSRLAAGMLRLVTERLCPNVVCSYGSNEGGPLAACEASAARGIDGVAGYPLAGVEFGVVDDQGAVLTSGMPGHLRIRAAGLADAYYGARGTNAGAFRDGWFHTQDIGTIDEDGLVVITGRADDLINIGGSKIAPEVIEGLLMRVPGMREAAAFGVTDDLGRHVVHAAIVVDGDIDVAALQAAFGTHPGIPRPSVVLRVPRLPRNDQGKVARAELVRQAAAMRAKAGPLEAGDPGAPTPKASKS